MVRCNFNNINMIRENLNYLEKWELNFKAIVSFIDPFCALAARMANEYQLSNFSYRAMEIMQNKLMCRKTLDNTIYNPKYIVVNKDNYQKLDGIKEMLPVVIKYIKSNGSRVVYFCTDIEKYKQYINQLFSQYPKGIVLVEEFLDGKQYIVETVAIDKAIIIEAVIAQEIECINDHFIITGYSIVLDEDKQFYEKLHNDVEIILALHRFENGPCHLEMRLVDEQWKVVEINPRISGAGMNQFLNIALGYNLVEEHLNLSLNQKANFKPRHKIDTFAEYITIDSDGVLERITGRNQVLRSEGVKYLYIKPRKGAHLMTPTSLGDRYAYVVATGKTNDEARKNAKKVAKKIEFHLV